MKRPLENIINTNILTCTISRCPYSQARCSGVDPKLFLTFTDAPLSSKILTAVHFPYLDALKYVVVIAILDSKAKSYI